MQATSKDGQQWTAAQVAFVLDTVDAALTEAALTEEANSHRDWRVIEQGQNLRVLEFDGCGFKKIFAEETTQFATI